MYFLLDRRAFWLDTVCYVTNASMLDGGNWMHVWQVESTSPFTNHLRDFTRKKNERTAHVIM